MCLKQQTILDCASRLCFHTSALLPCKDLPQPTPRSPRHVLELLLLSVPHWLLGCRDVEDTYLPAFRACVSGAGATSVMCSYNAVNGVPACASSWLLQEQLRDKVRHGSGQ